MSNGTARGSNPNQRMIYGRENLNYTGPEKASGASPTADAMGDFSGGSDETILQARLEDAFAAAAENESPSSEVYPHSESSNYGILHQRISGVGSAAEEVINEYVDEYGISDSDELISEFQDGQMQENIDSEVEHMLSVYHKDAPDYLYAADDPISDMMAYGENYGYTPDEEELFNHLTSAAGDELGVIPEIVEKERLYALRDNAESEIASWEAAGLVHTPRTSESAVNRTRGIRAEAAETAAVEVLRDLDNGDIDEESIPDSFQDAYQDALSGELESLSNKEAYRVYLDSGCDPNTRFDGSHSVSGLSQAVATDHYRSALSQAVGERISRLDG